eukprot:Awhi_evm2s14210
MSLMPFFNHVHNPLSFDESFLSVFPSDSSFRRPRSLEPKCDIQETKDSFNITAEFPGAKKEDISMNIHEGVLSLSTSVKEDEEKDETDDDGIVWHRRERYQGFYNRRFTLPENIKEEDIQAKFENGVLSVDIKKPPAIEHWKKPRKIAIQ